MQQFFKRQRQQISTYLEAYRQKAGNDLGRVHAMGDESIEKLYRFALRGKMIRGGMVALSYLLLTGEQEENLPQDVVAAGAAMELFQSAFLVHDDIMDRDLRRRGADTVFYEYVREAEKEGIADAYHTGESLGICSGDIAFFLAFEMLSGLQSERSSEVISLCSRELSYVGVAQMLDVYWGQKADAVTPAEVLDLYTYKTGRYTFSLPLLCGAMLAGASGENRDLLERIGELLGVVFQLKDDELGIFAEADTLGKEVGSDITEGKKTPFHTLLMERAGEEEQENLRTIFGSSELSTESLQYVRDAIERHGVRESVNKMCSSYAEQARTLIESLAGVAEEYLTHFYQLLDYSLTRSY
jgi:geranylgeranyl diphosphate synthase type I